MIDRSAVEEDMCRRADPEPRFDQTGTVFEEQVITILLGSPRDEPQITAAIRVALDVDPDRVQLPEGCQIVFISVKGSMVQGLCRASSS